MTRLSRFIIPGQPQHVILRATTAPKFSVLRPTTSSTSNSSSKACATHGCDIHAYVLMTNHVHLLITPHEEQSIAKAIQMLGRYYTQ